jgi:hypothetical protein
MGCFKKQECTHDSLENERLAKAKRAFEGEPQGLFMDEVFPLVDAVMAKYDLVTEAA